MSTESILTDTIADTDYVHRQRCNNLFKKKKKKNQVCVSYYCCCLFSYCYLCAPPGPKGAPFPPIADNLEPELCMENELESTI